MSPTTDLLVSVIVPVYNTAPTLLQTLDSITEQSLDKRLYEIIIVNDCSTDPATIDILKDLEQSADYKGASLRIIHHAQNQWLAETRNTGIKNAKGRYVCSLDSDDLIRNDYLKKSILALEAHPNAGITYSSMRCFGGMYDFIPAKEFNAKKLFWGNYLISAGVFRKQCWIDAGPQKARLIVAKMKWFEDWEFWIRVVAKGWYALPIKDTIFYYRQHVSSMNTRGMLLNMLSKYAVQRANLFKYPKLCRTQKKYLHDIDQSYYQKKFFLSPFKLFDRFSAKFVNKLMGLNLKYFPTQLVLLAIFSPTRFINSVLNKKVLLTMAEGWVGFRDKPNLKELVSFGFPVSTNSATTIFFCHYSWDMGGAENVLLDWIQAVRNIPGVKLIDIVHVQGKGDDILQKEFFKLVDEQFTIGDIGNSPLTQLRICWQLICHERPHVVFIMHNPFWYILAPLIKEYFPETRIVDLLHSEPRDNGGLFELSMDYMSSIDRRFVISTHWQDVLHKKYGEDLSKIDVAMNAVDLHRFDPIRFDKAFLCKQFRIDTEKFVIGYLGRLSNEKNPQLFVKLAELFRDDERFEFVVVGGGPLEGLVRDATANLRNLRYLGATKSPEQLYALFDLLICPSLYEGYPLCGMEAAAMNVPIIAADVTGFREQIALGKFGFLYEPNTVQSDAIQVKKIILDNLDDWSEIGQRGRDFAFKYHERSAQLKKYQSLLQSQLLKK